MELPVNSREGPEFAEVTQLSPGKSRQDQKEFGEFEKVHSDSEQAEEASESEDDTPAVRVTQLSPQPALDVSALNRASLVQSGSRSIYENNSDAKNLEISSDVGDDLLENEKSQKQITQNSPSSDDIAVACLKLQRFYADRIRFPRLLAAAARAGRA